MVEETTPAVDAGFKVELVPTPEHTLQSPESVGNPAPGGAGNDEATPDSAPSKRGPHWAFKSVLAGIKFREASNNMSEPAVMSEAKMKKKLSYLSDAVKSGNKVPIGRFERPHKLAFESLRSSYDLVSSLTVVDLVDIGDTLVTKGAFVELRSVLKGLTGSLMWICYYQPPYSAFQMMECMRQLYVFDRIKDLSSMHPLADLKPKEFSTVEEVFSRPGMAIPHVEKVTAHLDGETQTAILILVNWFHAFVKWRLLRPNTPDVPEKTPVGTDELVPSPSQGSVNEDGAAESSPQANTSSAPNGDRDGEMNSVSRPARLSGRKSDPSSITRSDSIDILKMKARNLRANSDVSSLSTHFGSKRRDSQYTEQELRDVRSITNVSLIGEDGQVSYHSSKISEGAKANIA